MTTEPVRRREKNVTRRIGWWNLEPGDVLQAVEKCQGLKKGEHVKKLQVIRVVHTDHQPLYLICRYDRDEMVREGFPDQTVGEFINLFCRYNRCYANTIVNRIVFEYLDEVPS